MGRGANALYRGMKKNMERGRYTRGREFDILWVRGQNSMGRGFDMTWVRGSKCHVCLDQITMGREGSIYHG